MPQYVAVSRERHGAKKWRRHTSYAFARADDVAPIVGAELSKAALGMPCVFVEQEGRYKLAALLSLVPGRNMFVGPDGRWLGAYIPAGLRFYPFRLLPQEGADDAVLCVDEQSGLVMDADAGGEPFIDADGKLAPPLRLVLNGLTQLERSQRATAVAVASLVEACVIRPWQVKLKTEIGQRSAIGLHCVDEGALGRLGDDAFIRLRATSGLSVAYAQLLSMGNLPMFDQPTRTQGPPPAQAPTTLIGSLPETLDGLLENLKDHLDKGR
jgi:hypothetical protein